MKNADADKYDLDGYGIVFDIRESFLLSVLFIHIHIQNSNKICKKWYTQISGYKIAWYI